MTAVPDVYWNPQISMTCLVNTHMMHTYRYCASAALLCMNEPVGVWVNMTIDFLLLSWNLCTMFANTTAEKCL